MTERDIPQELLRNAAARRERQQLQHLTEICWWGVVFVTMLVVLAAVAKAAMP